MEMEGEEVEAQKQKQVYQRNKETSFQRTDRRVRAEMRVYSRLVAGAQTAASHHTAESALARVLREFHYRTKQVTASHKGAAGAARAAVVAAWPVRCSCTRARAGRCGGLGWPRL